MIEVSLHKGSLDKLSDEWAELLAVDDRATPFHSPAWWRAWGRRYAAGAEPWVFLARDGDVPAGLLPVHSDRLFGIGLLRTGIEFADYHDVLARPDAREAVQAAIADGVRRRRHEWDVFALRQLPPGSSTDQAFEAAGLRASRRTTVPCPVLLLPETWDDYLASLPKKGRRKMRRYLERIDGGEIGIRRLAVEDLPAGLERWQSLRVRQWEARGGGMYPEHGKPQFRNLLLDVLTELIPAELAEFREFRRGDEVVGSFIDFCDRRVFYHYLGAFEPELRTLGVGMIAIAEAIRRSIEVGRTHYDFLRGAEEYKYAHGAQDRFSSTVVFNSGSYRSRIARPLGAIRAVASAGASRAGRARARGSRVHGR